MHRSIYSLGLAFLLLSLAANATTFTFDSDPFAGTPVLTTPGRQIVGGEEFISFSPGTDLFQLSSSAFGVSGPVHFINGTASAVPSGGVNVVVLETFDDDNNTLTPFGAGQAANLIADRITAPGAGFFIYFNQSLDLPRLVYSTDLSSNTSDLKILARMLNLNGAQGKNELPDFSAANFEITTATNAVPEPASLLMMSTGLLGIGRALRRKIRG